MICAVAREHDKPVRIGVNGGSLNQELVMHRMQENTDQQLGRSSDDIINDCMVESAITSTELALEAGLREDQIIISCKVSRPLHLVDVYRKLSQATRQPLHLGLTEAGMGIKGLVWSSSAMGVLLHEGIGDTIRVSLTPRPGGDRCEEVYAACELLQALGLRAFSPSVTACPGCGRTTSSTFQELAERIQGYIRERMPAWKREYDGVETMTLAVMGCVVNGPGESKAANIGISLPGTGEAPELPGLHRRASCADDARHLRGTRRCSSSGSSRTTCPRTTRGSRPRSRPPPDPRVDERLHAESQVHEQDQRHADPGDHRGPPRHARVGDERRQLQAAPTRCRARPPGPAARRRASHAGAAAGCGWRPGRRSPAARRSPKG